MPLSQAQADEMRVTGTSKFESVLSQAVDQTYKLFTFQDTFGSEGYAPVLMGGIGGGQEWLTTRVMHAVTEYGVRWNGKVYENSVKMKNTQVADAIAATAAKVAAELAKDAKNFPGEKIYDVMKSNANGLDGDPLFGEHTYTTAVDAPVFTNDIPGSNVAWYLLNEDSFGECTRIGEDFTMQVNGGTADSYLGYHEDAVSMGWRARKLFIPGFWANAVRSKAALTSENLRAAMNLQTKFKNDAGKRLGTKAKYLVVSTSNAAAAEKLIKAALVNGGDTNIDYGRLTLVVIDALDD